MGTLTQNIPTPLENKITNNLIYSDNVEEEVEEDAVSYFSDNSTQSSDTFDHQDYVAAVDPLENSHKTVYNDNVGCIIEVKTDDESDEDTSDDDIDLHQYNNNNINSDDININNDSDSDTSSTYSDTNEYEEPFQIQPDDEEEEENQVEAYNSIILNNQQPISPSISPSSIEDEDKQSDHLFDRSPSVDTDATTPLSKGTEFNLDDGQNYNNHYPLINKEVVINQQLQKDNNNEFNKDEDYNSIDLKNNMSNNNNIPLSTSSSIDNISNNSNNRNTTRLSAISLSELNEISLSENTTTTINNSDTKIKSSKDSIIAVATNVISNVSSAVANSVKSPTTSIFGDHFSNSNKNSIDNDRSISTNNMDNSSTRSSLPPPPPVPEKDRTIIKPSPINTNDIQSSSSNNNNNNNTVPMMSPSKSTPTQRFVSGLWSTLKTSTTPISSTSSSSSSSTTSSNVAKKKIQRPSDSFTKRQSRPPSCVLPGFQESLLAQMEQLNSENKNDPKAQRLLNLKRQSIRKSLVKVSTETPNSGDYDWDFWTTVICEFDQMKKSKEFNNQIRKGIPPSLRGMIWQSLANVNQLNLKEDQQYIELLKTTSPYEKMIQRDLSRSFPDHDYFKDKNGVGQEGLYNVVRAYSVYDTEVGYCQGLNFIVGPLLLNMPDEEAFSVLVQLMNHPYYGLRGHFTPTMEGLHLKLYQFNALVADYLPHISRHLQRRGVDPTMYASQWFMTLFAYKFPLDIVFRIYDIIFTEGTEAIFKFSLALLKKNEAHILELDFEHLLHFLKNGLFEEYIKKQNENKDGQEEEKEEDKNCQQLVHDACQWEIPRKRLLQLEKEHKQQILKEEQDAKLLESLQKQQSDLQQKVDQMNQSIETSKKEHKDVCDQLQDSQQQLQHMKDEQVSLHTVVTSIKQEVDIITPKIEYQYKEQFDQLCDENTKLNEKNAQLEDQLSSLEAILIDMKMRYAQSENERDELSKKFYELKKIFGQ